MTNPSEETASNKETCRVIFLKHRFVHLFGFIQDLVLDVEEHIKLSSKLIILFLLHKLGHLNREFLLRTIFCCGFTYFSKLRTDSNFDFSSYLRIDFRYDLEQSMPWLSLILWQTYGMVIKSCLESTNLLTIFPTSLRRFELRSFWNYHPD